MRLIDRTNGKVLASDVELADSFWRRFRGLMLRRRFQDGEALLFRFRGAGRRSVHMFFVRFPIDLVYLDSAFRVVELKAGIRPWRVYRPRSPASHLIELPSGTIGRSGIRIGHKTSLTGKTPSAVLPHVGCDR